MTYFTPPLSYETLAAPGVIREGEYWEGDVIWAAVEPYDSFLAVRGRHWDECPEGLIVFAETHGGDAWCWDTRSTAAGEHPTARVDVFSIEPFAPNFPGFLYRSILDALRELEDCTQAQGIRNACAAAEQVADIALQHEFRFVASRLESIGSDEAAKALALSWSGYERLVSRLFGEAYAQR